MNYKILISLGLFGVIVGLSQCNDVPVDSLYRTFSLQVNESLENTEPIKLDFLWVVDNSGSMCQEQVSLAANFQTFVDILDVYPNLDIRLAVVNTDPFEHLDSNQERMNIPGEFQNFPASKYPPSCAVNVYVDCLDDGDCAYLGDYSDCESEVCAELDYFSASNCDDADKWICEGPDSIINALNADGSVNKYCHRACDEDNECKCRFDDTYKCTLAGQSQSGCLQPPQTGDICFTEDGEIKPIPKVLDTDQLDMFKCIATVGADQSTQANLESGLKNAWTALAKSSDICTTKNPNVCNLYSQVTLKEKLTEVEDNLDEVKSALVSKPNDDQYLAYKEYLENCLDVIEPCFTECKDSTLTSCPEQFYDENEPNFLRDDAYLVIIFVTDEDDCSIDDDLDKKITTNDYRKCAFLGASDELPITAPASFISDIYSQDHWHPLAPVKKYVNHFKSLKSDPAKVVVASIAGDALIEGVESCVVSDECLSIKAVDECGCYKSEGKPSSCPELLHEGMDKFCMDPEADPDGCFSDEPGEGCAAIALEDEFEYRVNCIDACYSKEGYGTSDHCTDIVPEYCGCYDGNNWKSDECAWMRANEFEYRQICRQECFKIAKQNSFAIPKAIPYICASSFGLADFGSRYKAFAQAFGPYGLTANICQSTGIGPILEEIAELLIKIFTRICLPKPIDEGEILRVYKTTAAGEKSLMVQGTLEDGGDFVIQNTPECDITHQAVFFNNVLDPNDKVEVMYQASSELE